MRNVLIEETLGMPLVARLRELLPADWDASLLPSHSGGVDAVLRLSTPDGASALLTVEAKRWSTEPSSRVVGALAALQRQTDRAVVLITDYTNRPIREACQGLGINYIDGAGWAYLRVDSPAIFIRTQGEDRPAPRVASEVTRLNGVAVGRIMRTLLEVPPPIGVRDLANRAAVKSPGSVSKLLPTLLSDGAIERDDSGKVVAVHRQILLKRWTRDYSFFNGNGLVLDYLAPRGVDSVLQRLTETKDVCVTGSFAGRAYLRQGTFSVVPPTTLTVYSKNASKLAEELGLVRTGRQSSNVIIAVPRDAGLLNTPPRARDGLPIAPLPQVLADLLSLPGRESLLAEQIMDQLADSDPAWGG